jgi:hypothetical protein
MLAKRVECVRAVPAARLEPIDERARGRAAFQDCAIAQYGDGVGRATSSTRRSPP